MALTTGALAISGFAISRQHNNGAASFSFTEKNIYIIVRRQPQGPLKIRNFGPKAEAEQIIGAVNGKVFEENCPYIYSRVGKDWW